MLSAPASLHRRLAALLLGLFVSAWLLDAHHRAWVPHVVCAEDGEIAHGSHGDRAAGGPAAPEVACDAEPCVAPDDPSADGHDHCGLPDLGRTGGFDPPIRPACGPPPPVVHLERVHPGAPAHEAVSQLFLAPKQSPPPAA